DMWDLTVANDHDFHIVTTASTVLVHNCPASDGSGPGMNSAEARSAAKDLGYKPTKQLVKGQQVFQRGGKFISQDVDSHSGGVWKMANSPEALASKAGRLGTYDGDLNWIGP
ncbi:MAG: hypothetical protein JWP75_710, partial [Frondihabitans sp.]|nr:hypothetical protein [Frondihabitans sp.]